MAYTVLLKMDRATCTEDPLISHFPSVVTTNLKIPVSCTSPNDGMARVFNGVCTQIMAKVFCLFVLRFYGPVNPMGSCRARSVYLTTRLLGRLSPLSG